VLSVTVDQILVVGGGTMGRGVAQVAAQAGYATTVVDVSEAAVARSLVAIRASLDRAVARGHLPADAGKAAAERLSGTTDLEAAAAVADFVIENVPEDMATKRGVFEVLGRRCRPGVVMATNTSALSITEITAASGRPESALGMHFFNPVPRMKLVELVRALGTGDEAHETARDVAARLGKDVVTVNEYPGLVTSRINAIIGNEAFHMLQEGVASAEDIDKAIKLGLNHPMGPFEMADMVGLDVRLGVLRYLHATLGEKFRPAPLLVKYVQAGRLGRKAGRGV
jgi:3-hydroxybutyryl-CoA dehydrogenase